MTTQYLPYVITLLQRKNWSTCGYQVLITLGSLTLLQSNISNNNFSERRYHY